MTKSQSLFSILICILLHLQTVCQDTIVQINSFSSHKSNGKVFGGNLKTDNPSYSIDTINIFPKFPGGIETLQKFIKENIRYPFRAGVKGIEGLVIVNFAIEEDGNVSDVKILKGIGSGCDEIAIRAIKNMPKWSPGYKNNIPIKLYCNLPIYFEPKKRSTTIVNPYTRQSLNRMMDSFFYGFNNNLFKK